MTKLCADIGGSFMDTALVHPDGTLTHRQKHPTPLRDLGAFLAILTECAKPFPHIPLHIALAGLQDPTTNLCTAANIPCINGVPLSNLLSTRLNRPIRIANDADCFTLAESHRGAAQGHHNVMGIILGTGVGGGLVLGGTLITGTGGLTGEWGHGPFIPDIPDTHHLLPCFPCACGQKGCIDTIGGARGLEHLHRWAGGPMLDSRAILAQWRLGEPHATRTISLFTTFLSAALALAVNTTGATCLPVGGGLSNAPDLIACLDTALRTKILRPSNTPLLVPSRLGNDAGLIGAALLSAPPVLSETNKTL